MQLYQVLIKENEHKRAQDIVFLKYGFSFYAFLFSGLWLLYHKMWQWFLAITVIGVLIHLSSPLPEHYKLVLETLLSLFVGMNANYWRFYDLTKRQYKFVGAVFGTSLTEAKVKFFSNLGEGQKREMAAVLINNIR